MTLFFFVGCCGGGGSCHGSRIELACLDGTCESYQGWEQTSGYGSGYGSHQCYITNGYTGSFDGLAHVGTGVHDDGDLKHSLFRNLCTMRVKWHS